jgi:hypothetical protein
MEVALTPVRWPTCVLKSVSKKLAQNAVVIPYCGLCQFF